MTKTLFEKDVEYAKTLGYEIVKDISPSDELQKRRYLIKRVGCGHERERDRNQFSSLGRDGECLQCKSIKQAEQLGASAVERGFDLVSHTSRNAVIKCQECGTQKTVQRSNLNRSNVRCKECGPDSRNDVSFTYVVKVTMNNGFVWIKAGSTRFLDYRIKNISSKNNAAVELIKSVVHPDRHSALDAAMPFKEQYQSYRLDIETAIKVGIKDGRKECFSEEVLQCL